MAFGSYEAAIPGNQATQYLVRRDEDAVQMKRNIAAGISNLGYTYTKNSTRNLNLVYADIDNFVNFYGRENIAGYFIDEVNTENNPATIAYMANIYNYIKTKYPGMLVLANNGWGVRDAIAPYADVWMLQEVSADEYINAIAPEPRNLKKTPQIPLKSYTSSITPRPSNMTRL